MRKTAIVTGASRGIGRTIALRLAADGFGVVVNYAGNAAKAEEVVNEITSTGGRALAVQADVANPEDVKQLFDKTLKSFGQIDVVVNNAGIMPLSPIAKGDVETFDKVIATNLRGTFLVLSQAAQHVAEGGRIIAFSSSVLAKNFPTYGPYIASKAGVEGLVHVLANELRGHKITVNAIAPGPVGTELFLDGKTEEQIKQISSMAPLERLGQPDDIAGVVFSSLALTVDGSTLRCSAQTEGSPKKQAPLARSIHIHKESQRRIEMKNVIVITGASSGFGALAARALAVAGHTVYASMRETTGRNAAQVETAKQFATENHVDLRTIELDVASQESADQAIKTIVEKDGHLDVVVHNAGHMVFGPVEAFTPEQLR